MELIFQNAFLSPLPNYLPLKISQVLAYGWTKTSVSEAQAAAAALRGRRRRRRRGFSRSLSGLLTCYLGEGEEEEREDDYEKKKKLRGEEGRSRGAKECRRHLNLDRRGRELERVSVRFFLPPQQGVCLDSAHVTHAIAGGKERTRPSSSSFSLPLLPIHTESSF